MTTDPSHNFKSSFMTNFEGGRPYTSCSRHSMIDNLGTVTASTRESVLPGLVPNHPHNRGQAEPGHVAGRMALRAPGPRRLSKAADHSERLPSGRHLHPTVPREPHGQHEQLGKTLGALSVQALTAPSIPKTTKLVAQTKKIKYYDNMYIAVHCMIMIIICFWVVVMWD